jgi:hypothetical protein
MVKIYIKNISLQTISDHIDSFKKYYKKKHTFLKLYSEKEYYIIENNNIYYIEPILEDNIEDINYGNLKLLIDYNNEIKIPILSQLPVNYIYTSVTRYEYKFNNITLIIDGIYEKKQSNIDFKKKNLLDDFTEIFIPIDFFLEYNEKNIEIKHLDFTNKFLQEELNVFLLHLI